MNRLNEIDYDILELLQSTPECLKFVTILEKTGKNVSDVHKSLTKLLKRNYVGIVEDAGMAAYRILENNERITILQFRCPICKTPKRVYTDTQESTVCINPKCLRSRGLRKQFGIMSKHFRKKGIVKRINLA